MKKKTTPLQGNSEDEPVDNMQKRIKDMFAGQEPPSYVSIRDVDAMKVRIAELEAQLSTSGAKREITRPLRDVVASRPIPTDPIKKKEPDASGNQQLFAFRASIGMAIATLLPMPLYLYLGAQSPNWYFTVLTQSAILMALISGTSAFLAYRKQVSLSINFLVGALSIALVAISALVSGLGIMLGLSFVVVSSLLVGQTLSGKNAIRASMIALVGSISTVILDLYATWERLNLPQLQALIPFIAVGMIATLGFTVLRRFAGYPLRLKLTILLVGATLVTASVLGLVTNQVATNQFNTTLGSNFSELANRIANEIGDGLRANKLALDGLTLNKFVQDSVQNANQLGISNTDILLQRDQRWINAADNDPFIYQTLNNEVAIELKELQARLPQYAELFVTDTHGSVIASTNRTSDYYQADEDWWQGAWNNGEGNLYISQPEFDESASVYAIDMALPIPAHNDAEIVGILRATINISEMTDLLSAAQFGETGQAIIVVADGNFLAKDATSTNSLSAGTLASLDSMAGSSATFAYDGVPSLVSQAAVTSPDGANDNGSISQLGWTVVIHQSLEEVNRPVATTTRGITVTALVVLLGVGLLALYVGNQFAKPIETLTRVAEEVGAGNLFARADERSQDEVGTLAGTFNRMTSQLQSILTDLEQRVAERTHDLELATEVGQAISEKVGNLTNLLNEATETIRERFDLYYTQVYLLDPSGRMLLLRSGTGEVGKKLLERNHRLPLSATSLNSRAASTRKPVLVGDTQQSEGFLPNTLLPFTRSELAIPLVANDNVVGVLDMQSDRPNAFNEANLPAFQVLAGQIAIAIQNATLFRETEESRELVQAQVRRLTTAGWQDFLNAVDRSDMLGYLYDQHEILPVVEAGSGVEGSALSIPVEVTGAHLGDVRLTDESARQWTRAETEVVASTVANLAKHIETLRLLAETERYRAEAEEVSRRLTSEGWNEYLRTRREVATGFVYQENKVAVLNGNGHGIETATITHPILVREQPIGELLMDTNGSTDPHTSDVVAAVIEQLSDHIENLRLLEQAEMNRLEVERSQEQYELAVEGSNDGVWDWDIVSGEVYFSPRWKAMIGYEPYELNNGFADFERLLHPDDHDYALKIVNDYLAGKINVYDVEFRFEHKDGSYRWIRARGKALRREDGSPYRMAGSHTDITQSKRDEEILAQLLEETQQSRELVQKSQERFELAVRGSDDGVWDWDIANDSIYYSPRWKSMLGFEEHELTRGFQDWEERIHPEDRDHATKTLDDYLAQKTPEYDVEIRMKHKNGHWVWIRDRGKALRREDGTAYRMAGAHTDISERKENEKLIAQRASQLETVATVSSTASTVLDPDMLLQSVVDLTKERFGLYHVHIYLVNIEENILSLTAGAGNVGRTLVGEKHAIPLDREKSLVARAAREQQPVIVNDVRSDPDFLPNKLLPNTRAEMAVPMIVGSTVLGVFDVQSDTVDSFSREDAAIYTTLAAQVAIALQNARLYVEQAATVTQLRELDRLKSSFLAAMSHELRTPLNSILGFTDVMLEGLDGELTEYMDNDLRLIQKNGQHLLHLINDVLDMAKIESGKMNLHPENFNLHIVLGEVISITAGLASDKKLTLAITEDTDRAIELYADSTRVKQVMINLVNNAIKFTETGGITVSANMMDSTRALIKVKDTGIGIPTDKQENIFQEFTQVDTSTTRKAGGTGLGLPISRRLVEMHGGRVWVESTGIEGEGSTFFVEMPLEARITEVIEKQEK